MKRPLPYRIRKPLTGRLVWPRISAAFAAVAIVASLLAIWPGTASADIKVSEDDIEDHVEGPSGYGWLDEWDLSQGAGFVNTNGPHSGASHLRLRGEGASAVRSAEVVGESSLRLRLWARVRNLDDNEAVIEVSGNGSTYAELIRWNDGDQGDYAFFDFDLAATGLSFVSQVWVRARISGDDDEGDLFVDDIELVNSVENPDPQDPGGTPIVLDSNFADWSGKSNIADPSGDQSGSSRRDIAALYWANNIDEGVNYHMIERHTENGQPFDGDNGQSNSARYILYIDTNNNGSYSDPADRRAIISYDPKNSEGRTKVKVYPANSNSKIADSGWNDWGETRGEGGLRVEFPLDWNDLGISFGGVIRMYAVSYDGSSNSPDIRDRAPDGNADIQWSPASVLGPLLLGAAGAFGIVFIWFLSRRRRLWT